MSIAESLARASRTSHLGDSELRVTDSDFLKASGAVAQTHGLGVSLIRLLYAHDLAQVRTVLPALAQVLSDYRSAENALILTGTVLQLMMHPACPECRGRGAPQIKDSPVLSDETCGPCDGTGKRQANGDDEAWLVEYIETQVRHASLAIAAKLA